MFGGHHEKPRDSERKGRERDSRPRVLLYASSSLFLYAKQCNTRLRPHWPVSSEPMRSSYFLVWCLQLDSVYIEQEDGASFAHCEALEVRAHA